MFEFSCVRICHLGSMLTDIWLQPIVDSPHCNQRDNFRIQFIASEISNFASLLKNNYFSFHCSSVNE